MDRQASENSGFLRALVRAFIPVWIVAGYGIIVLPSTGTVAGPPVSELAWYQQIASYTFLPAMVWSWYRLHKIQKDQQGGVADA